jgi:hypothetical protein
VIDQLDAGGCAGAAGIERPVAADVAVPDLREIELAECDRRTKRACADRAPLDFRSSSLSRKK